MDVAPITVVVGPSESRFFVHSTVLEKSSEFFRAALKPQWIEGQHDVKLPEDDPCAFKIYAKWLYTGNMGNMGKLDYPSLVRMYVLAEKLIDPTFQDLFINAIVARSRKGDKDGMVWVPGPACSSFAYQHTMPESPVRRLMVSFYLVHGGPTRMKDGPTVFEKDFLFDLATALLDARTHSAHYNEDLRQITTGVPCAYHKHAVDKLCKGEVMAKLLND